MLELLGFAAILAVGYFAGRGRRCRHRLEYVRQTEDRALVNACACGLRQEMLVPPVADLTQYVLERIRQ